jgi:uncharacterized protein (TIGR02001 family)
MKYLILASLLIASPALAQTTATVSAGTDYIARGASQTYDKPALTLYAEHQFKNGLYIGGFAGNIDFNDGTKVEADVLAGYRTNVRGVALDVGAIYITYHGTQTANWNMLDVHVSATKNIGKASVTGYVGVSPNYFNYGGRSVWSELSGTIPVGKIVSISGRVGYYYIQKDIDYVTWNAGVSVNATKSVVLDLRYVDTNWKPVGVRYLDKIYAPRVVLTVRKSF